MLGLANHMICLVYRLFTSRFQIGVADVSLDDIMKHQVAQSLSCGPAPFSTIVKTFSRTERTNPRLAELVKELADFKAPTTIQGSGTYILKEEFLSLLDPQSVFLSGPQKTAAREYIIKEKKRSSQAMVIIPPLPSLRPTFEGLADLPSCTRVCLHLTELESLHHSC